MENDTPAALSLKEAFDSTFHGKYSFDDFLTLDLEKEYEAFNIHDRSILKTSVKLKKYLRFLNSFIFDNASVNKNVVHSYQKGKSAYTAVLQHAANNFFFKTDLQNFFKSITKSDIQEILENNLAQAPIHDIDTYKENILNLICIEDTLPIGFSTSPNITNTFLYKFDNELERHCDKIGVTYTRYSDDIILSSKEKHSLSNIDSLVHEHLQLFSSKNLELNLSKTKFTHRGKKVILLGMVLMPNGEITVDNKVKKQIESLFHFYINDKEKFESCLNTFFNGKISSVSGKLNHINTVDKTYSNKLRKKYGNFIVDYFCNKPADQS